MYVTFGHGLGHARHARAGTGVAALAHAFPATVAHAFPATEAGGMLTITAALLVCTAVFAQVAFKDTDDTPDWTIEKPDWSAEASLDSWMGPATQTPLNARCFAIRDTSNKGLGLFTCVDLERGTYLFDYTGAVKRDEATADYEEYDGMSDYALAMQNAAGTTFYIDGAEVGDGSNLARYMNHDSTPVRTCGTMRGAYRYEDRSDIDALPPPLHIFTERFVKAGEELCWDYGPAYWLGREENKQRWELLRRLETLAASQAAEGQ